MVKKSNNTKFYTVAGFSRIGGCLATSNYTEIFYKRSKASKFIADEINNVIEEENAQNPDNQMDKVTAKECTKGYRLSSYNDKDDIVCLDIVEHTMAPINAVVTFDQDDRTLNITTVESKDAAEKRVAECAKSYVKQESIEYLYANREGMCEIDDDGIEEKEEYVHAGTTGGNFTAWTAVQIPVLGKADIEVQ
jgi:predicted nucleic acid-binding protein